MSLHIGNLSAGIHIDDLQRVFQRFGTCTVRVKDKYGFVVYDYPASAEKALKTLRGTRICGQAITLSWSNRQPRNLQRPPTREKSNEQLYRRHSVKQYANRRLGSYDRRENERNSHEARGELKTGSSDLINESISYHPGDLKRYVGENSHSSLTDHHGIGGGRKNHLNVSRRDKQAVDPLNENYLENNLDFDRYEPHDSDSKKELDDHTDVSPLVRSPSFKKIQNERGRSYNEKSQKSCPLERKRYVSGSRGRLHPIVHTAPLSSLDGDREPLTSKSHQRVLRSRDSSIQDISPRGKEKEFKDKKRNRRDYETQDKSCLKRPRAPSSSPIHSDYTSPRSQSPSRSLKSLSLPSSRLKWKSVLAENVPIPSSHGSSPSRHSENKTLKSRSESGSLSPISSLLSKEVNQNVSSSPDKAQEGSKVSLANAVDLHQSTDVFDEETQLRRSACAIRSQSSSFSVKNKCETRPGILEQEGIMNDPSGKDNYLCHSFSRDSHELLEPYVPLSDGDDHIVNNFSLHSIKGMKDSQNEQHVVAATESNISLTSNASSSVRMSLEEVQMVLKHYGLQHPETNEKDLPVDVFFGSARLWPWEMIYYRRLKKGPISTENHSRRTAQNAEFGIVDRHIRGSSGWGELHENNS